MPGIDPDQIPFLLHENENPDSQPESFLQVASSPKNSQSRTMTPKSSAITARTNYVSPYRQTPPANRSVSSPVVGRRGSGPTKFKDIVTRFNTTSDEKIPVPTNRIPASTAGHASLKAKKPQTWKAGVHEGRRPSLPSSTTYRQRSSSTTPPARGKLSSRPSSAKDSYPINQARSPASPQSRPRRSITTNNNVTDKSSNSKTSQPLQTSFLEKPREHHRRSRSALDAYSPSAASLADNEDDGGPTSRTFRPLQHRRSRSNIEISNSSNCNIQVDLDLVPNDLPISPRSPRLGRSGIPVSARSKGGEPSNQSKKSIVPALASPHGSRHASLARKSPNLNAIISVPVPKNSPPLRSSRGHRLPTAVNSANHASRQRFQGTTPSLTSSHDSRYQRAKGRRAVFEEGKRKEQKRTIPEIGTVDFEARRAQIQSAFTKSLKENDERKTRIIRRNTSNTSLRSEIETVEEENESLDISQGRIEEENEEHEQSEKEPTGIIESTCTTKESPMETIAEPIKEEPEGQIQVIQGSQNSFSMVLESLEEASKAPTPTSPVMDNESTESILLSFLDRCESPELQLHSSPEHESPSLETQSLSGSETSEYPVNPSSDKLEGGNLDETEGMSPHITEGVNQDTEILPTTTESKASKRFSRFFMPEEYPYTASQFTKAKPSSNYSDTLMTLTSSRLPTSSKKEEHTLETAGDAPVSVTITTDTPAAIQTSFYTQVSQTLGTGSAEWCTDSEISGDSPVHLNNESPFQAEVNISRFDPKFMEPLLTPTPSSMGSTATFDDRRTIASVYSKYDDHGEDIVKGYTHSEAMSSNGLLSQHPFLDSIDDGNSTEIEDGSHHHQDLCMDDTDGYTSCSEVPVSPRPSLEDMSLYGQTEDEDGDELVIDEEDEGWTTTSDISPDLADHHPLTRRSVQQLDSPTTPRQPTEADSLPPPTPPPKDIPPPLPEKDKPRNSPHPTFMSTTRSPEISHNGTALLPEIEPDSEPLGLAIQSLPSQFNLRPTEGRQSLYNSELFYARPSMEDSYTYESSRPSIDQHSYRPSIDHRYSPSSGFNSEGESRRSSSFAGPNGSRHSETPATSLGTTNGRCSSSIHSSEQKDTPEQKALRKRRMVMKEILDTECAFFRDMTVAEEIYKGSASACLSVSQEDIKVIFGNSDAIIAFSKDLQEMLKNAVASVYVMRRGPSGINSSAASVANSTHSDEPTNEGALSDEEKDRRTFVGEAFASVMCQMERLYGDYCKNHDIAVQRLEKIQGIEGVVIWLAECRACAEDLTNAWNLGSLLIKPVQRVLKYPLLLGQLLACTPNTHPDYPALEIASKEMKYVADRINTMKKRKDMVDKIVSRKRNESDIRHGISKSFARRAQKLRQSVGLSEVVVDETYNRLFENYNMHFFQIQVIARDIEIYVGDVQAHIDKLVEFASSFKRFADAVPTQYPDKESKWRRFETTMKEIANTYLQEHRIRVRQHAIDPLETLLKMHESPQIVMTKRNKKAVDYARYRALKDRGDVPDKKTTELAEAYVALNETLIEELPRLFALTKRLVDVVLLNFIDLQAQWMNSWASKLKMAFVELEIPHQVEHIFQSFIGDFSYNDQFISQLMICNADYKRAHLLGSPANFSLSLETLDTSSFLRPRTADDRGTYSSANNRERAMSLNSQSPTYPGYDRSERRHSGGASLSPLTTAAPVLPLPPLLNPVTRTRSTTTAASHRIPPVPPMPGFPQRSNLPESHGAAQTSYISALQRPPLARAAYTANAPPSLSLSPRAMTPSPPPPSAAFSSAMPMEDDRDREYSNPPSVSTSRVPSRTPSRADVRKTLTISGNDKAMFVVASLFEFNIDKQRREAGFPYLTYVQGEIFDVIGVKGEIWLARNQDDSNGEIGWIWCKHFCKLQVD